MNEADTELVKNLMVLSKKLKFIAMEHPEYLDDLASAAGYLYGTALLLEAEALPTAADQPDPMTISDM